MTTTTLTPQLERKSLFGGQTKVLHDEGEGIVEAIVSVTGVKDEVDDIIVPGAYAKTLAVRWPKGVSHHDWETPVAKALDIKELLPGDPGLPRTTAKGEPWPKEAGAVLVKMQYNLNTQRGRDAYEDVKFFDTEQEWSIGYNVPRNGSRVDHKKGIRYIDTLDWYEFSDVLFGAMPMAGTHSIKSLGGLVIGSPQVKDMAIADTGSVKMLDGSYEQRRNLIEKAVTDVLAPEKDKDNYEWVSVQATFDDHVIVCHMKEREDTKHYDFAYTIVGDEVTLGEPKPVKIEETVVPVDEADDSDDEPGADAVSESDLAHKTAYLSPSEIAASKAFRDAV